MNQDALDKTDERICCQTKNILFLEYRELSNVNPLFASEVHPIWLESLCHTHSKLKCSIFYCDPSKNSRHVGSKIQNA
jgi:hypothetical protein